MRITRVEPFHVEGGGGRNRSAWVRVWTAAGLVGLQGIKRLIDAGLDIVQPDIVKTGGFTGLGDMAALARAHGVDPVPHQTQPSIGHTANLHFVASLTHAHHPAEYNGPREVQDVPWTSSARA
jgi:L-alanine-DL-glutamate epimerase-like enolase superfamily enzyme